MPSGEFPCGSLPMNGPCWCRCPDLGSQVAGDVALLDGVLQDERAGVGEHVYRRVPPASGLRGDVGDYAPDVLLGIVIHLASGHHTPRNTTI